MSTYAYNKARKQKFQEHPELIPARVHGSTNGYNNYGCRCAECKAAWAKCVQDAKEARAQAGIPEHVHGTPNGYGNYKCRCRPCTDAWSKESYERTKRRNARKAADQ